jgi:hypothetical protein
VEDGGCGDEHGEVITWVFVSIIVER